jgi:glycosyltransferase involved in cell wall biosynthesis
MASIYCTADRIGTQSGGGLVTLEESKALAALDQVTLIHAEHLGQNASPFAADEKAHGIITELYKSNHQYKYAHFYAGTFSKTVRLLQDRGVLVTYTAAAHDIKLSREEFASLGVPYNFPHIIEPTLWARYIEGYVLADCVICPSRLSFNLMRQFGCKRVAVVPHGCTMPETAPLPNQFCVGYLGQIGPDKGLQYLLAGWKLTQRNEARLLLAGRDSVSLLPMARAIGGGNIEFMGWVDSPSDLYNRCSVYCQPSVTEGFGIEVLEALAHGRPVIVSAGAGAADLVEDGKTGYIVPIRNPHAIAERLCRLHDDHSLLLDMASRTREAAQRHTWDKIHTQYHEVWKKAEQEVRPCGLRQ